MTFEEAKESVVRHEVGHWFVAKVLGYKVDGIRILIVPYERSFDYEGSTKTYFEPTFTALEDVRDYLYNRITILLAGTAFQSSTDVKSPDEILQHGAVSDKNKFDELIRLLRAFEYPNANTRQNEHHQYNELRSRCWERIIEINNEHEYTIDCLVEKIKGIISEPNIEYHLGYDDIMELLHTSV